MVREHLVERVAHEPADGDVDLRFAHQPPIMDKPEQEACEHQPNCHLRVDPRPPVVGAVEIRHLIPQPREIEHTIDTGEDVIVGNELTQGSGDEELQLIALLAPKHRIPLITPAASESGCRSGRKYPNGFINSPLAHRMRNLAVKVPTDLWPEFKARATACYQAPSAPSPATSPTASG